MAATACGGGGAKESSSAASTQAGESSENDPYADPYQGDKEENDPYADPYQGGQNDGETTAAGKAAADEYMPEAGEKYTVTKTADGWIKIENKDGEVLGLSPTSGVHVVEDGGLAFKDLNQNQKLDIYEDWRKTAEERAKDLVGQMKGEELAVILAHGGWGDFTTEALPADNRSTTFLQAGGRGGVTRNIGKGGAEHAKWTNSLQSVAESCYYGIPAMVSIDPAGISGLVETAALASTMNPELAGKIGQETAKQYRAAGVSVLLGPQVDIASPMMSRAGGTYGEDPKLTLDLATAYVNGLQSTYKDGKDIGWGEESVFCFTKHFAGAGSTEGGRDDHANAGRYAVFPGNNLEAHLITYFDGVFKLPGATKTSGIMTEYAINTDGEGKPFGGEWAGAYNPYMYGMLKEYGFEGLKITDWGVYKFAGVWGAEDIAEIPERIALSWEQGAELLGGYGEMPDVAAAYTKLVERNGEEKAKEIVGKAAEKFVTVLFNLNLFDQPYNDSAYAASIIESDSAKKYGIETQRESVVMIKNDGSIKKDAKEKPKVYVPYVWSKSGKEISWANGIAEATPLWEPGLDLEVLKKHFEVVTDTLAEPSGEKDKDGKATYKFEDLTRASEQDIAACDFVLVGMKNAYTPSHNAHLIGAFVKDAKAPEGPDAWYPASLQYAEYKADTAREVSISGKMIDGQKENRSYKGQTAAKDINYGHLDALTYAAKAAGDVPVVVSMAMDRGMVWSEVEPLADVILVCYNKQRPDVVAEIMTGKTEPKGLLVFQQPQDMQVVEAQLEDVPRDMACYKDANGNSYDFAFGLNWSGVIKDERVNTYSAAPLTKVQNFDYGKYSEANR